MTDQPVLDPLVYRDGMARYAGHVQIVTTRLGGVSRGVTVTAACSVSDAPPTVLVCLNSTNPSNEIFEKSRVFALNTLAAHHQPLATAFAGLGDIAPQDRFSFGTWGELVTGAPVLEDAAVSFDCELLDVTRMSTHVVMFGSVKAMHFGPPAPSLIYLDRDFRAL